MSADNQNHELVGVAFLCIDRLEFLLDHDETITIVNFGGFPVGNIKLSVKAYIDEVQALPTTIVTHVEANIQKFMDHSLIVNFYFDNITDLPENHCSDTYISFKFMSHMPTYTSTQYLGYSVEPTLESTVQVVKPITAALVDYIRTGCMEFKVFAVRSKSIVIEEQFTGMISPQQSTNTLKGTTSWNAGNSQGTNPSSRASSFRGDKASLEKKLAQTSNMAEALMNENHNMEQHMHTLQHNLDFLQRENDALRSELQSARAEIDNIYNISRGDGATIISNHESTMMPSASRGASSYGPSRFFRGSSANIPEHSETAGSRFCVIM